MHTPITPVVVRPAVARTMLASCAKNTLVKLIKEGKIESFLEGRARWVVVDSIHEYVRSRRNEGRK